MRITNGRFAIKSPAALLLACASLARRLWEQYAADNDFNFAMLVHPNYPSPFQLTNEVRREFGHAQPRRSLADELNDLHDYLIEQHKAGKTNVLVVDEAQKMKPPLFELLRQLLNFETSRAKLLQIVLFGQNELVTKIDRMPALKDRVTIFGALTSLTRDDADALIAFRWKVAGGDAHPFEPEALDRIFRYGRGLPRKICNLCNNALIRAYSAKRLRVDAGTIEQVAQEILEQLGDNHSKAFYRLVAAKVPETKIRQILAELKADGANHPVRLFTCKVRRYALTGSP